LRIETAVFLQGKMTRQQLRATQRAIIRKNMSKADRRAVAHGKAKKNWKAFGKKAFLKELELV
jgi:hypothetical protein